MPRSPSLRLVAVRQCPNELVGLRGDGGAPHRLEVGVGAAVANVVGDRTGEQGDVLRHERHARAQLVERGIAGAHAIDAHRARLRIEEAQQQIEDRALAGAGRSDEGDRLAGTARGTRRR